MRRLALLTGLMMGLWTRAGAAECLPPRACVDPEPLWIPPSAARFVSLSEPDSLSAGEWTASAHFAFRLRPAVLTVPAPNRDGRDVNVLSHATDVSLAARFGLGHRLELTFVAPAGLYQRGAGIKGVTSQSAEAIPAQGLHDPRLGFGFELPRWSSKLESKLRFEAKLPLGTSAAGSTEAGPVASPSLALWSRGDAWFGGAELGLRLRQPASFFGLRVGSQAWLALGLGYAFTEPRLTFALEAYALPSLIDSGPRASTPSEWLLSATFSPRALRAWTLGLAGGGGVPLSSEAAGTHLAYGVPTLRAITFARYAPGAAQSASK